MPPRCGPSELLSISSRLADVPTRCARTWAAALLWLALALGGSTADASEYSVIYRFRPDGKPGVTPYDLVADAAGNLYGTTSTGGRFNFGAIYRLTPPVAPEESWNLQVLHSFRSGWEFFHTAGAGSLVMDKAGNLYGVTAYGGKGCGGYGCGTVFKLAPPAAPGGAWTYTTLFVFAGWNGYQPRGLALDHEGHLYGATYGGGRYCGGKGCGIIYELVPSPDGGRSKLKILYYFTAVLGSGDGDGAHPYSLAFNDKGVIYGLTSGGGHCDEYGCYGAAFQLTAPKPGDHLWTEKILYRFRDDETFAGVTLGGPGVLYGTTVYGAFQLLRNDEAWTENVLVSGDYLYGRLALDAEGNLYGTTLWGREHIHGTVFKLTPPAGTNGNWTYSILHAFGGGRDGELPENGVTWGPDGVLYGTTIRGGNLHECEYYDQMGCGIVFRLVP